MLVVGTVNAVLRIGIELIEQLPPPVERMWQGDGGRNNSITLLHASSGTQPLDARSNCCRHTRTDHHPVNGLRSVRDWDCFGIAMVRPVLGTDYCTTSALIRAFAFCLASSIVFFRALRRPFTSGFRA